MHISAPMLCALSSGGTDLMDSWEQQDYMDGYCNRSRAARKLKVKTRRSARRSERLAFKVALSEELS